MQVSDERCLPFTQVEAAEIAMYAAHYAATKGCGSIAIEVNFNDGKPGVVVVNGRRFKRETLSAGPK